MRCAMIFFAALCIGLGVWPRAALRDSCRIAVELRALHGGHVVSQLQLLLFSGLAFFLMLPLAQADADDHARHGLALSPD